LSSAAGLSLEAQPAAFTVFVRRTALVSDMWTLYKEEAVFEPGSIFFANLLQKRNAALSCARTYVIYFFAKLGFHSSDARLFCFWEKLNDGGLVG
jgi:hypothetical protein